MRKDPERLGTRSLVAAGLAMCCGVKLVLLVSVGALTAGPWPARSSPSPSWASPWRGSSSGGGAPRPMPVTQLSAARSPQTRPQHLSLRATDTMTAHRCEQPLPAHSRPSGTRFLADRYEVGGTI